MDIRLTDFAALFQHISTLNQRWVFAGLSLDEYLDKVWFHLKDIVIDLQQSDTWKNYLTTAINFISSKDAEEECVMHSKSDNAQFFFSFKIS